MTSSKIAILGGGFAGMAAAQTLNDQDCTVYEARAHAGGHSSSFAVGNGFLFDEGPHVSFTPHDRVRDFLASPSTTTFASIPRTPPIITRATS